VHLSDRLHSGAGRFAPVREVRVSRDLDNWERQAGRQDPTPTPRQTYGTPWTHAELGLGEGKLNSNFFAIFYRNFSRT